MAFKVNLLTKGIIISGWVEIWRLPEAEAEHSLKGSDKPLLMEKVLNFVTVNSVMKRYNLKRSAISEVTKNCNFKRFVGEALG